MFYYGYFAGLFTALFFTGVLQVPHVDMVASGAIAVAVLQIFNILTKPKEIKE